MNIPIREEHISLKGIAEDGTFFTIIEDVGYSKGDERPGFNRPNAGEPDGNGGTVPLYVDAQGQPYPRADRAAFLHIAYRNVFHTDDIQVVPETPAQVRDSVSEEDDYDDIALEKRIESLGDGWYTVYTFLLDALHPDEDNIPLTGVYFNRSDTTVREASTGRVIDMKDLIERDDVYSALNHFFITPKAQIRLNDLVGEMVDVAILKGDCSKEYKRAQRAVFFYEAQLAGAHVKFNDGYRILAQQIIEDLENSNPYGEC